MQRHRLFAAGVSVALLLGAAAPALAAPGGSKGKGHAYGHNPTAKPAKPAKPAEPAKPAKEKKVKPVKDKTRVNGGGTTAGGAEFSVQGKANKLDQAHFNYTKADGSLKVRCRSFETMTRVVYVTTGPPAMHVTANCVAMGPSKARTPMTLDATFTDNGETGDTASITLTGADPAAPVTDTMATGNINVR